MSGDDSKLRVMIETRTEDSSRIGIEVETSTTTKEPAMLLQGRTFQALWKECVYMVDKKIGGMQSFEKG